MKVATMRRLDRWLGVPACFALTLFRKVLGGTAPGPDFRPQKILFVKLAEQGSTVLAYGALRRAVERVGRENVYFLLFAENRPILDLMNVLPPENVIAIDAKGLVSAVLGALKAIVRMRRERIDAAVDLEFFARSSAAMAYLSGARWRAGYHAFGGEASYRGDLMTHRVSFNPYLHTSQTFQILIEVFAKPTQSLPTYAIHAPTIPVSPPFQPAAEEIEEVRAVIDQLTGERRGAPVVLLNANASDLIPLRRWSPDRYVELAQCILQAYPDALVALTGAPNEASAAEEIARRIRSPRCISMAGKTTLRQLLVLCHLAEVLVTNDSGPAHFATLTPIDVVVLFGPETPKLFAATSPRTHALWAGIVCSPCINAFNDRASPCRDNQCMQLLSVEMVFEEVRRHLDRRLADVDGPAAGRKSALR